MHEIHRKTFPSRVRHHSRKLRRALGLKAEDQLIAETTPEGLLLRPAVTLPVEMYSEKQIREFDEAEAELTRMVGYRGRARKSV